MTDITKYKLSLAALGLGLALASGAASAVVFFPPITGFQDDDLDKVNDINGNGIIDIGDNLVSIVEIVQTLSISPAGSESLIAPDELSGIVELAVVGDFSTTGIPGSLVFGPLAGGQLTGAEVAKLWLDTTPDLNTVAVSCLNFAACLPTATDGTPFLTLSLIPANGDAWGVPGGGNTNIASVQSANATTTVGFFNFDTTITFNGTGQSLDPNFTGSGNILGGQGLPAGSFTARSDFDAQVSHVSVPEPASIALLAIGLLGLGFANRKRQSLQ